MPQIPSVGRDVHYVARGSADGVYPKTCRAAKITEVSEEESAFGVTIGLVAFNPTGFFFHSLSDGGCQQDDSDEPEGGTWHWPERIG